ncbi:MAG: hypothetical protein PHV68_06555 [Candidatus Gastranaerophilales bacterium]|nr:hypothetical protein [Candidatus Gastranaerophilales bacterium]
MQQIFEEVIISSVISVDIPEGLLKSSNLRIKLMSIEELLISLERLTRFKLPDKRRKRVYRDIILRFLVEPKINSQKFAEIPVDYVDKLVKIIWNNSVRSLSCQNFINENLNLYLAYEETKLFKEKTLFDGNYSNYIDYVSQDLLNISSLLKFLEKNKIENLSLNTKRLIEINKLTSVENDFEKLFMQAKTIRKKKGYIFPLNIVILAEGATEEKLLPAFAKIYGLDFAQNGILLIASGGKNQVARLYNEYKKCLNIPVMILLDEDAKNIAENIQKTMRTDDNVFVFQNGEFEDIISKNLIIKCINNFYKNTGSITKKDLELNLPMAKILENLWREKGFGEFNKSLFAQIIAENISSSKDVPLVLKNFFNEIEVIINKQPYCINKD